MKCQICGSGKLVKAFFDESEKNYAITFKLDSMYLVLNFPLKTLELRVWIYLAQALTYIFTKQDKGGCLEL